MKPQLFLVFLSNLLLAQVLVGQDVKSIVFRYRCVPTSTTDYSIEITKDKFILNSTEKIPGKNGRITKVDSSNYTYSFGAKEKEIVDSIIKVHKLDSAGLYERRITEWGTLWEIDLTQNSITTNIKLPNYNNAGLEALIHFIVCLIPKKERPVFECKACS